MGSKQVNTKRPFMPLPSVVNPLETICYQIYVPDDPQYIIALFSLLEHGKRWNFWERDGTNKAAQTAERWVTMVEGIVSCSTCMDECIEYRPIEPIAQFFPYSPYNNFAPQVLPYTLDAWRKGSELPNLFNFRDSDIVAAIGYGLPLVTPLTIIQMLDNGFPRFRVQGKDVSEIEIELIKVALGGWALITQDGDPLTAELIDLEFISIDEFPTSTTIINAILGIVQGGDVLHGTHIHEIKFDQQGDHFVDVTLIPKVTDGDNIQFYAWGGGVRKIQMCGNLQAQPTIVNFEGDYGVIGEIKFGAWDVPPDDFLLCDGSIYPRTTYPKLYEAIAVNLKIDADFFRVPNFLERTVIGYDANTEETTGLVGDNVGSNAIEIEPENLPEHTHKLNKYGAGQPVPTLANSQFLFPIDTPDDITEYIYSWNIHASGAASRFWGYNTGLETGTQTNTETEPDAISVKPRATVALAVIRFRNSLAEVAAGVPGQAGAPGECGEPCEPQEPENPPPPPASQYPPESDIACIAAESIVTVLYDKYLLPLADLALATPTLALIASVIVGLLAFLAFPITAAFILSTGFTFLGLIISFYVGKTKTDVLNEWGEEFREDLRCMIYCEIGENGQFTEEGFSAFKARLDEETDDRWGVVKFLAEIMPLGSWNTAAQMYVNAGADCTACDCNPEFVIVGQDGCVSEYLGQDTWRITSVYLSEAFPSRSIMKFFAQGGCMRILEYEIDGNPPSVNDRRWNTCANSGVNGDIPVGACFVRVDYGILSQQRTWTVTIKVGRDAQCE